MKEQHFYVENARLLSFGLSNLGTASSALGIIGNESCEVLAGKLVGLGVHCDKEVSVYTLTKYLTHKNSFIRRCAYIGLSFSGLFHNAKYVNSLFEKGFHDSELEVRKAAILGYGLVNSNSIDQSNISALDSLMNDKEWKIRSAVGLAYSFIANGNPEHFAKISDFLKEESSPYVKVCSSWYISNAFSGTKEGFEVYAKLLRLDGEENSFFRDMACIGLGFAFLGTSDHNVNQLLRKVIVRDKHPYVRESAYFGLALCNFRNPDIDIINTFKMGLSDDSSVVRSGAALSLGFNSYGTALIEVDLNKFSDPSVLWGLTISEGLSGVPPSKLEFQHKYVQWGFHIGNSFRNQISLNNYEKQDEVSSFQKEFNKGLIGSGITANDQKEELRLIFPGVFHYLIYDSFWWGLWVMSSIGITLKKIRNYGNESKEK